ncbi:MAG: outer membrane protein assembly factor BamA [Rickettsiales bacterium]
MKKNKLFNIFLIFFANLIAVDIYPNSFYVRNNKRLSDATILYYLEEFKDTNFNSTNKKLILEKFFNTGLFNNIYLQYNNNAITLDLYESPVIANISLKGNKKFKSKDIFNSLFSKSGATFTKSNIDLDILLLQNLYTQKNSYLMNVKAETVKVNDLAVELKYEIEEGPTSYVKNIYFIGLPNSNKLKTFLYTIISTKRANLLNRILNMPNYDPMKIEQDKQTIINVLKSKGYLDAQVNAVITNVNVSKQEFNVNFYITQGQEYIFNSLQLKNNTSIPIEINSKWFKKGEIFNKSKLDSTIEFIKKKLSENGYPKVQITDNIKKIQDANQKYTNQLDIEIIVDNAQKYYIDEVLVFNNLKTKTPLILRKANIKEGSIYDSKDIAQGTKRLMSTGYFHNVTPDAQVKENGKVQVKLQIEEKSTASFGIKGTMDDKKEGSFNITFSDKNLLGTGIGINTNIGISTSKSISGNIGIVKPYFFDSDAEFSASLSYINKSITQDNIITDLLGTKKENYHRKTTKFNTGISYNASQNILHIMQLNLKKDELFLNNEEKEKALNSGDIISQHELGSINTFAVANKFIIDLSPDKPFNDTNSSLMLSFELAVSPGDAQFIKSEFEYKFVKQIQDETHFKLKLGGGIIFPYGDYKLKVDDKFILDIRGFDSTGPRLDRVTILGENELKKINKNNTVDLVANKDLIKNLGETVVEKLNQSNKSEDPEEVKGLLLNGEYYFIFSIQVDKTLILNELFKLSAGPFIDAGYISGCNDDNYKGRFFDSKSIKASIGLEAIVSTQFIEFRTGVSYDMKKGIEDKEKAFFFKVGAEW